MYNQPTALSSNIRMSQFISHNFCPEMISTQIPHKMFQLITTAYIHYLDNVPPPKWPILCWVGR